VVSRHVLRRALDEAKGDYDDDGNAHSRRLVHQATGMVLAQLRLPADDARLVIQGHAFATNRSMMDVADDIVNRRLTFSGGSEGIEASS
jgi:AmiR/NasT family two-component response regulator